MRSYSMRILAIDTSNQPMSVALMDENGILAERTTNIKRNHSTQLMPTVEQILKESSWGVADLDRIAIAKGPGSYTGVRIGVTVAKTLAWTAGIELVGVSSLKVLAGNASLQKDRLVSPIVDARRGNIYTNLYKVDADGQLILMDEDTHISIEKWAGYLAEKKTLVEFVGQDVVEHETVLKQKLGQYFLKGPKNRQIPRAGVLAEFAEREKPVDVHTFVPEYTKLAEAEQKWKEAHPDYEGGIFVEKI